jgi:predicted enzyme related to lactoylglutathione lyase
MLHFQGLRSKVPLDIPAVMDKVAHFEIPADDLDRAQNFYGTAFGWKFMSPPGLQYLLVQTTESDQKGPKAPGAINGGILVRKAPVTSPVITINVDDMDEALGRVEKAGGKVVHAKFPVGSFGFSAYVKDTEGNVIGIWQSTHKG